MNISFLLTGKPPTFLLYFLSFENSVCALYIHILEREYSPRLGASAVRSYLFSCVTHYSVSYTALYKLTFHYYVTKFCAQQISAPYGFIRYCLYRIHSCSLQPPPPPPAAAPSAQPSTSAAPCAPVTPVTPGWETTIPETPETPPKRRRPVTRCFTPRSPTTTPPGKRRRLFTVSNQPIISI